MKLQVKHPLKRNPFGHYLLVKKWLIRVFGVLSHPRYQRFNKLNIQGSEVIRSLPERNVLFVSNHQTYFADVAAMLHVFNASLKGRKNTLKNMGYLWRPKLNIYFVAAKETMRAGLLPKIFTYIGSVSIERTWRSAGKDTKRQVKMSDLRHIEKALADGWVITFPQGTTTPFKPIRRGTAHVIKTCKPVVVPVVLDGFRRSFNKKGLLIKKKNIQLSMEIKKPMKIDYENETVDQIVERIQMEIKQHPSFLKVPQKKKVSEVN